MAAVFETQPHRRSDRVLKNKHEYGDEYPKKLERKHLDLRTRIKRLARRTICFSNQTAGAVGVDAWHGSCLLINHVFFNLNVHIGHYQFFGI